MFYVHHERYSDILTEFKNKINSAYYTFFPAEELKRYDSSNPYAYTNPYSTRLPIVNVDGCDKARYFSIDIIVFIIIILITSSNDMIKSFVAVEQLHITTKEVLHTYASLQIAAEMFHYTISTINNTTNNKTLPVCSYLKWH